MFQQTKQPTYIKTVTNSILSVPDFFYLHRPMTLQQKQFAEMLRSRNRFLDTRHTCLERCSSNIISCHQEILWTRTWTIVMHARSPNWMTRLKYGLCHHGISRCNRQNWRSIAVTGWVLVGHVFAARILKPYPGTHPCLGNWLCWCIGHNTNIDNTYINKTI